MIWAYNSYIQVFTGWWPAFFSPDSNLPTIFLKAGQLLAHILEVQHRIVRAADTHTTMWPEPVVSHTGQNSTEVSTKCLKGGGRGQFAQEVLCCCLVDGTPMGLSQVQSPFGEGSGLALPPGQAMRPGQANM